MSLAAGTRIGPYEILAPIGAGGMGEVYRARDTRLDRDVAIKILPELFVADAERLARFEREAKTLASLNHPNIAQIYGIEPMSAGLKACATVMEFVDGEDLSDRIARGPIPVADALAIARQIADALEAAHERGIIHRDLKPANIKVRDDGRVKVLDFGLAKAIDPTGASSVSAMNSPTITSPATQLGVILGTAAYMAPEQAKGRAIDRRADVWAFGVVLYEMLTGRRAFDGDDISEVLASVLKDTPSQGSLPAGTPGSIRRLLRRCLEKNPSKRLDSMAAARLEIDEAMGGAIDAAAPETHEGISLGRAVAAALIAAVAAGLLGGVAVWRIMRPAPATPMRLSISPPEGETLQLESNHHDVAISPDGTRVLYWNQVNSDNKFVMRHLDRFEGVTLNAPVDARGLFFSHDGSFVGFQNGPPQGIGAGMHKIALSGGSSVPITGLDGNLRGASWLADDTIVFATGQIGTGLFRVRAGGSEPARLTTPNAAEGEQDHVWPHALPGGTHVLFSIMRAGIPSDIALLDIAAGTWRVIVKDGTMPKYVSSGHLVYATAGTLRAVAFDLERLQITGDPAQVLAGVVTKDSGAADYDISRNGTLVYMPGVAGSSPRYGLTWTNRAGAKAPLNVEHRQYRFLRVAPDGQKIAAAIEGDGAVSIWIIDLERETLARLTPPDVSASSVMAWSPDSKYIAATLVPTAPSAPAAGVFRIAASGTGAPERLAEMKEGVRRLASHWSRSGELFLTEVDGARSDILRVSLASGAIAPLINGPSVEGGAALSPDQRWLAYATNETGRLEVYVRPYPNIADDRIAVSTAGGVSPVWTNNGRELIFFGPTGHPMSVSVTISAGKITFGKPALVVEIQDTQRGRGIGIAPDGSRFISPTRPPTAAGANEYRVVINWLEELKALVKATGK